VICSVKMISNKCSATTGSPQVHFFHSQQYLGVLNTFSCGEPPKLIFSQVWCAHVMGVAIDIAFALLKEDIADYQGQHQAPIEPDYHSPLHDMVGVYSEDLYSHLGVQYYGDGSEESAAMDRHSHSIIMDVRGKPDAEVMVHRAVPHGTEGNMINPGDWVSTSKAYAIQHGWRIGNGQNSHPEGFKLLRRKVKAKDLFSEGSSLHEYGWRGHT